jgi:hypothetical protein
LLVEEIDAETVVYDTDSGQAHCLSPLAAAVFAGCDGSNSVEELVEHAGSRLGEPIDAAGVDAALAQLEELSLLTAAPDGVSRRTFVGRTAIATAAVTAAPMVTSIVTPAFAQGTVRRCPGSRCVSQSEGDVFCGCNNACPAGSPGAGSPGTCTSQGLTPPFFDSCFCAKCPTPGDPNPGQVPAGFTQFCPPINDPTLVAPCGGGGTPNMGCKDPTKPLDGICVPNDGDSSEACLNP